MDNPIQFVYHQAMDTKKLPKKLRELVSRSVALLGRSIKEEYGQEFYQKIEKTRQHLSKQWSGHHCDWQKDLKILEREYSHLSALATEERLIFAHCYTCMLELINHCESSYRSFRLSRKDLSIKGKNKGKKENWIVFVLTAHPTEARGPEFLAVFGQIAQLLEQSLYENSPEIEQKIYHLLRIIMKVPLTRRIKPEVIDEAKNICNFVLKPEMLDLMVKIRQGGTNVLLRTWAGGDKDGHPGVNEKTMMESFHLSRKDLLSYVNSKFGTIEFELEMMKDLLNRDSLLQDFQWLVKRAQSLEKIKDGDGQQVLEFRENLRKFKSDYESIVQLSAESLQDVLDLIWLFPALVLPLEVREDSEVVAESLKNPDEFAISKMLSTLARIAKGYEPKWYVRGFVLSMCEKTQDILNGIKLTEKMLAKQVLPIVPLFETEKALIDGPKILEDLYNNKPKLIIDHQEKWGGRFEIMLGYSDSSKESGVLPSRLLISKAMKQLDRAIKKHDLTPIFFHGSGGSVERGGGSIQEQTRWWPKSAISVFKATIQGEMVARNFASPQIFSGQIKKITEEWSRDRIPVTKPEFQKVMASFAKGVQQRYQETIHNDEFLKIVEQASPYMFLSQLKIGSRPSKRTSKLKVGGLRAIPWILCWTQTRVLFPTWWGVGSTWESLDSEQKELLRSAYEESDLLRSFVKLFGFTLEKVELAVFRMYLEKSELPGPAIDQTFESFLKEYTLALKFWRQLTGKKNLLWHRPWLEESIKLRSPMIHPLNILQLMAVENKDAHLLRKTVTGVACGMLTTG